MCSYLTKHATWRIPICFLLYQRQCIIWSCLNGCFLIIYNIDNILYEIRILYEFVSYTYSRANRFFSLNLRSHIVRFGRSDSLSKLTQIPTMHTNRCMLHQLRLLKSEPFTPCLYRLKSSGLIQHATLFVH